MYKKGLNTFCRKVDRSQDIERNAFFKMAATLIPIRPRQSIVDLDSRDISLPALKLYHVLFFHPISHIYWAVKFARRMPRVSS